MSFPVRRMIEFIYSADIAYVLEFGEYFVRVYYADEYITTVVTPYASEHLFELQHKQIGDVMRIVHPQYKPRKLSRTTSITFTLEEIEFTDGPFMTRNDLIDPLNTTPTTMTCSATIAGTYGSLIANSAIFSKYHVGALFQLTHPKATIMVSSSGPTDSSAIYVKGSWRFITRGTWTGTFNILRNENGAGWDIFRTYKGSTGAEQNISLSLKEDSDNVQYMIDATNTDTISAGFRAELSTEDLYASGVVQVVGFGSPLYVSVKVITRIESITATRKWAEGSWSDYRGWPASLTFFEDRCVYAGALSGSDASNRQEIIGYPSLIGLFV
jgi:hypothetical protein